MAEHHSFERRSIELDVVDVSVEEFEISEELSKSMDRYLHGRLLGCD